MHARGSHGIGVARSWKRKPETKKKGFFSFGGTHRDDSLNRLDRLNSLPLHRLRPRPNVK